MNQFDEPDPQGEDPRQVISLAYSLTSKAKLDSVKDYVA